MLLWVRGGCEDYRMNNRGLFVYADFFYDNELSVFVFVYFFIKIGDGLIGLKIIFLNL